MKKVAGDLINELDSLDLTNSNIELFVKIRKETGNDSFDYTVKAIDYLDVIEDECECLLVTSPENEPIEISDEIRSQIAHIPENFTLYACYEITLDDGLAKVKIPIQGFEKDPKRGQLTAMCGLNKSEEPIKNPRMAF